MHLQEGLCLAAVQGGTGRPRLHCHLVGTIVLHRLPHPPGAWEL